MSESVNFVLIELLTQLKMLSKIIEDLGNMSNIGKMRQDCVKDLKQAGEVI